MLTRISLILFLRVYLVIGLVQEDLKFWRNKGEEELNEALNIEHNTHFAKNVIIFIGDGMDLTTITTSRIHSKGEAGFLAWEKFNHIGVLKTYSNNKLVPDSCSTATALFTGVKANHETSGVDGSVEMDDCLASLDEKAQPSSILDWASMSGKATGFVTTTRVTHGTPSALYAHTPNRKWECEAFMPAEAEKCNDIAYQLVKNYPGNKINVIMGGGRQTLQSNATEKPGDPLDFYSCRRMDGRDLINEWKQDKLDKNVTHAVVSNTGELESLNENTEYVLGIFANGHMQPDYRRDKSEKGMPSLRNMTEKAIKLLKKNKNGFILMVEGGLIDLSHHRGHAKQALDETRSLSDAVESALSLVNTEDTLIIVTSDHSHSLSFIGYLDRNRSVFDVASHTIGGDKTPYTSLMYSASGIDGYQYSVENGTKVVRKDPSGDDRENFEYFQQTGMLDDESPHGGTDVLIYATGPMSHLVHSVREQTFVAYLIKYAAQIGDTHVKNESLRLHSSFSLFSIILFWVIMKI